MTDKVLVPVEPTLDMDRAGEQELRRQAKLGVVGVCSHLPIYKAMLAAAPHTELPALEKAAAIKWAKGTLRMFTFYNAQHWFENTSDLGTLTTKEWNRACTILEANGMLERHPENVEWVRIKESEDG